MKLTVDRKTFTAALKTVLPAIPRMTGTPVLYGVRIVADLDNGAAHLTASSLDTTITHKCGGLTTGITDQAGTVVVNAAQLSRLVSAMSSDDISLETVDTNLTITSGTASASLPLIPAEEYPRVAVPDDTLNWLELTAGDVHAIGRVLHAVSTDRSRILLTGVALDGGLARATDSYRLAQHPISVQLPDRLVVDGDILRRAINLAGGDTLHMSTDDHNVHLRVGDTTWTTRPVTDGEQAYPTFGRLIRDQSTHSVTLPTAQLLAALNRMTSLGVDGDSTPTVLTFTPGECLVDRVAPEVGTIEDRIECDANIEPAIAFRGEYLADLISHVETDEVTLHIEDSLKPVIVRDGEWTALVMPVRSPRTT